MVDPVAWSSFPETISETTGEISFGSVNLSKTMPLATWSFPYFLIMSLKEIIS